MKNKSLTPQIRFKGFEDEWSPKSLLEPEFIIQAGGDIDKSILKTSGRYPVIANALVGDGVLGYYDNYYRIEAPAVSITGRGDVGVAVPRRTNFTPVVRLLALTSPNDIDFLSCAINLHPKVLESTGVPQLTVPKLQSYFIYFPILVEQRVIGNFFKQIDEMIAEAEREVSRLEKMKQASLQKMFPRPGATAPEIRFAGFDSEWKKCKLSELLTQRIEHQKITEKEPLLAFSYSEGIINPEDKKSNKRDFLMTDKYNKIFSRTEVDDIIYNPANVIHGAIHRNSLRTGVVSPIYKIFRCNENIYPKYMGVRLRTSSFISEIFKYIEGTVIKLRTLSPDNFLNMEIDIPESLSEQEYIGEYFRNLDSLLSAKRQKLVKLRNIKQACLDKMFVNTSDL